MVRFLEKVSFQLRAKFSFGEWQRGGRIVFRVVSSSVNESFHAGWKIITEGGGSLLERAVVNFKSNYEWTL